MLLDDIIPAADFREMHATWVRAPPERVYAALKQVTPAEVPLFRVLLAVRGRPARRAGRPRRGFDGRRPLYDQVLAAGFARLAEAPDRELVVGRLAQFWALTGGAAAAGPGACCRTTSRRGGRCTITGGSGASTAPGSGSTRPCGSACA